MKFTIHLTSETIYQHIKQYLTTKTNLKSSAASYTKEK
jgi:hypothetical protein